MNDLKEAIAARSFRPANYRRSVKTGDPVFVPRHLFSTYRERGLIREKAKGPAENKARRPAAAKTAKKKTAAKRKARSK